MPRADKIEFQKRLLTIQGWIIDGVPSALIIQQILLREYCTSERHAERLLSAARKKWIEFENEDINEARKMKIQELKQLKRGMKDAFKGTPAGIRAIIAVDKEIIKIAGLAAPKVKTDGSHTTIAITNTNSNKTTHTVPMISILNPHEVADDQTNQAAV